VNVGNIASLAPCAVVAPVPPLAILNVPPIEVRLIALWSMSIDMSPELGVITTLEEPALKSAYSRLVPVMSIFRIWSALPTPVNPVPPLFVGTVGKSFATNALNVGAAALPLVGPAHTLFAVCVAKANVNVPVVVTGLPDTVKIAGADNPTLVTVPEPAPVDADRKAFSIVSIVSSHC